jgi:hypothetical protein
MTCDLCRCEVPSGKRFCPRCGLEIVPDRERASQPPPLNTDVFDWNEPAGKSTAYAVSQGQPAVELEELRSLLLAAKGRLEDGDVRDAAVMLNRIRPQVGNHVSLRPTFEHLHKSIESRKRKVSDRCQALADEGDSARLVWMLVGPATNDMEPEEICSVALKAARTLYDAEQADEAHDVLRIASFRTVRDQAIVQQHSELAALVGRRRYWQHWRRSMTVLGGVCILGGIGLTVWAWFLWRTGLGAARRFVVPGLVLCAIFLSTFPQWKPTLEKWLREYFDDEGPGERLKAIWTRLRK